MNWRCKHGWHKWSIWTEPIHVRSCLRCGYVDDSAKAEWVEILVKAANSPTVHKKRERRET